MLHDMLEKMATVGDASIVSWQPHGKAFRVHHPEAFARTVMPNYFKQTKYKSFQRQLHMYGFQRIRKGLDTGAYFHSMFIRNKKSMSLHMSCQKIKGENAVQRHASGDPNFYSSDNPMLQASTIGTEEKQMTCREQGPATVLTNGNSYHHTDDEKPLIGNSALLLNQEATGDPSASDQLLDWMEQATRSLPHHAKCLLVQLLKRPTMLPPICFGSITRGMTTKDSLKASDSSMSWKLNRQ
jgi:hypothetical protein